MIGVSLRTFIIASLWGGLGWSAIAEELQVRDEGITIAANDLSLGSPTLLPFEPFDLCFEADSYAYAPGRPEEVWAYFEFVPLHNADPAFENGRVSLSASVGAGGVNRPSDVAAVVDAFRSLGNRSIASTDVDEQTVEALITGFQNRVGVTPDARIDPGGYTERVLNERLFQQSLPQTALENRRMLQTFKLVDVLLPQDDASEVEYDVQKCVTWRAPEWGGTYEIRYAQQPLVQPVGSVRDSDMNYWKDEFRDRYTVPLGEIIVDDTPRRNVPYALTLQLNGNRPSGQRLALSGGATDDPLRIEWSPRMLEDGAVDIEYSVRMSPTEADWSAWTSTKRAEYTFLLKGFHKFELRSRYRRAGETQWTLSPQISRMDFDLDTHMTAPISSKGLTPTATGLAPEIAADWIANKLYTGSKAFLAGVSYYEAPEFEPLVFVENDLDLMAQTLETVGFDTVVRAEGSGTRSDILDGLQDFLEQVETGDRVVLYFSMHGFESETDASNPYLASQNCNPNRPGTNCIPLNLIEELVRAALAPDENGNEGAQHVLVILDACSVGMGLMRQTSKSITDGTGFVERRLIDAPGAHVMTAGLADQVAFMDNRREISFFTSALASGLTGGADYIPDGIITLRELELFVRHRVALETQAEQTPMVGDIAGAGQIAFVFPSGTP